MYWMYWKQDVLVSNHRLWSYYKADDEVSVPEDSLLTACSMVWTEQRNGDNQTVLT